MQELDITDAAEFKACAEVNKDLIINGHNEGLFYSPLSALAECIAQLRIHDYGELAELYDGWLAFGEGNLSKAHMVFTMLDAQSSQDDDDIKEGLKEAMAYLSQIQHPQSEASEADSLSNYGIILDHLTIRPSAVEMMGLEETVKRMLNVLQQSSNRSMLLAGPSGIGKTAAIHLLARRFWEKGCPDKLKNFRIFQVATASIVAGAKYIGEWQRHLLEVCAGGSFRKKVILYFEDIANIFGAGTVMGDPSNFADYLIPRIENREIVVICEMNKEQAGKLLTVHPKFERLLSRIDMDEPSESKLTMGLTQVADFIGKEKSLNFSPAAITEIIELNNIFLPYRAFPGKGIDLIKRTAETFSKKKAEDTIQIDVDEIILAFCEMTGIPDFIIDKNQALDFDLTQNFFMDRVLGQEDALYSIINAVTTFKARLCDSNKPIKSFLFVGPTGVGKTESAKVLAEYLFGSKERMIRLNMSEYSEPDCVSKLLGKDIYHDAPNPSNFLTSIREQPFSIVLLDEIEKAHPLMFNLLLQLLDEGTLQDSVGRQAFFQSSIIIMTSNIGARNYTLRSIGFGDESKIDGIQEAVLTEVKEFFSPEIYNRFDEVICFKPLGMDVLEKIINREIGKVLERRGIAASGCAIDIDPLVRNHIIETGYDPKYGARHIKRAVEKSIALPLARLLASEKLKGGDLISIGMSEGVPTAQLIEETPPPDEEFHSPTSETDSLKDLKIPGKGLKNMIESLEGRVISLRNKFNYEAACRQKENLQKMMNQPDFWDDPKKANNIIKRLADLNKKTERIRKWDSLFEKIKATAQIADDKLSKPEIYQTKSQLFALLKELESAELEVLLEGQHDYSDAFLVLGAAENNEENIRWLLEITGVYIKWAKRRGFIYRLFGEDSGNGAGQAAIFMHIGGLNAYGLLKNESGIHKKIFLRQPPRGPQVVMYAPNSEYDCNVMILPDIEYPQDEGDNFNKELTKLKSPVPGMKMRSLQYKISMKHKGDGESLQFYSDSTVQNDKNIAGDLFRAYLENLREQGHSNLKPKSEITRTLVRTYETGDRNRIIDHRSKIIIQNPRDYLSGKIDSLLLERIL